MTDATISTSLTNSVALDQEVARILIVDDLADNRELLARPLRKDGHDVLEAASGEPALKILEQNSVDLILLDVMFGLGQMDGIEVLHHLKSDTKLREVPVIMISASTSESHLIESIKIGAEDFLPKPCDQALLRARIGSSLLKKRLRDGEQQMRKELMSDRKKYDQLLLSLYPHPVVQELKADGHYRPGCYKNTAVLFCDIVGFATYCDEHDPEDVVLHLQKIIETFEEICTTHRLEKIKTIGDAFMATAGLLEHVDNPVLSCVRTGFEMIEAVRERPPGWDVRVGIHCGAVVAGVVGSQKNLFDLWGDTVNTAARMESHGIPGRVNVSAHAWQQIADVCRGSPRVVNVKGEGQLEMVVVKEELEA